MPNLFEGMQPTPFAIQQILLSSNSDVSNIQRLTVNETGDSFVYGKVAIAVIIKNMYLGSNKLDFVGVEKDFTLSLNANTYYSYPRENNSLEYVRHPLESVNLGQTGLLPMVQGQVFEVSFKLNLTPEAIPNGKDVREELTPSGYFTLGLSYTAPVLEKRMRNAGVKTLPQLREAETFQEILLPVTQFPKGLF